MREIIARSDAQAQELKRYFTGKPCKRNHVCERRVCDYSCLKCEPLNDEEFRKRHRKRLRTAGLDRYYANRENRLAQLATRNAKIRDLLVVLRQEMPALLEEFGL